MKQRVKRKCKKRKSSAVAAAAGNMSEASESSLDEALKDYMETMAGNHSDSDVDLRHINKIHQSLLQFASHSISVAESDSFTENFSPMRPGRRRRRFKRMAVDPKPDSEVCITDYMREQRLKRLTAGKLKGRSGQQLDSGDDDDDGGGGGETMSVDGSERCGAGGEACDAVLGKRKRGMKPGSSLDVLDDDSEQSNCKLDHR